MRKNKKGISPLIATVLIIGFTIVLAALVITWGTKLFKTTVEETETASKFSFACSTGLKLEVLDVKMADDFLSLVVKLRNNNQALDISDFRVALNFDDGNEEGIISSTPDNKLKFPVAKEYTVILDDGTVSGVTSVRSALGDGETTTPGDLASADIYPAFEIEGETKSCESAVNVKVK